MKLINNGKIIKIYLQENVRNLRVSSRECRIELR